MASVPHYTTSFDHLKRNGLDKHRTKYRIGQQDLEKRNRLWFVQSMGVFSTSDIIFEFPASLVLSLGQLLHLFCVTFEK